MLAKLTNYPSGYKLIYQLTPASPTCKVENFDWEIDADHVEVYNVFTMKTLAEFDTEAETSKEFALELARAFDEAGKEEGSEMRPPNSTILNTCPNPMGMNIFLNSMAGQRLGYQETVSVNRRQYNLLHRLADKYGVSYPEMVRTAINELLLANSAELGGE